MKKKIQTSRLKKYIVFFSMVIFPFLIVQGCASTDKAKETTDNTGSIVTETSIPAIENTGNSGTTEPQPDTIPIETTENSRLNTSEAQNDTGNAQNSAAQTETAAPAEKTIPTEPVPLSEAVIIEELPVKNKIPSADAGTDTEQVFPKEQAATPDTTNESSSAETVVSPVVPIDQIDQTVAKKKATENTSQTAEQPASQDQQTVQESKPSDNNGKTQREVQPVSVPKTNTGTETQTESQQPVSSQDTDTDAPSETTQQSVPDRKAETDNTNDIMQNTESPDATQGKDIEVSRSVTMKRNQYLDVTYPGQGWIYLGENDNKNLMLFFGRKLGTKDTTFTLRSGASGNTILHFYKNDLLTGHYIDDYLQVTVTDDSAETAEHVKAPDYADYIPPAPQKPGNSATASAEETTTESGDGKNTSNAAAVDTEGPSSADSLQTDSIKTSVKNTDLKTDSVPSETGSMEETSVSSAHTQQEKSAPVTESSSADDDLLTQAEKAYNDKDYSSALDLLSRYFDTASERIDAALFLQGEIYEAKSNVRDIRSAIASYNEIVENWPESSYWEKARERSVYLTRFYIDIR